MRTSTSKATGPHSSSIFRMLFPWMKILVVLAVEFNSGEDGELQCSDWLGCGPKARRSRLSGARLMP